MKKRSHNILLASATALVLVATACGSTVQFRSQSFSGPSGASSNPASLAGNQGLGLPVTPGSTQTAPSGVGPYGPGAPSAPGSPSFSEGSTFSAGGSVQGVFPDKILVGAWYVVNSAAANQAIGGNNITQGDDKGYQSAVIDDINKHGGVLGRKLVPVWHVADSLSNDTAATTYQSLCEDWRSHHVFAAIGAGNDEGLLQCLTKYGIIPVNDNGTLADTQTFRRYPYYVEISVVNLDRMAAAQVPGLAAQGYFSPWNRTSGTAGTTKAKVGVMTYDAPSFHHAVDKVLVPALKRLGYDPGGDVFYVTYPQRNSDAAQIAADVSSAVLRFNTDGVDHVMIIETTALLTLFFLNQAESQHYYPRYGFNSQNGAQVLLDAGDIQADQLRGLMGIGWVPSADISSSQNPDNGPYSNDARRHCLQVMKAHGYGSFPDTNAEVVALLDCNDYYFFRQALTAGGSNISRNSYLAGVNNLGSSFQSGVTFTTYFGPSQHDGASSIRHMAFQNSCQCIRYTSGLINIG